MNLFKMSNSWLISLFIFIFCSFVMSPKIDCFVGALVQLVLVDTASGDRTHATETHRRDRQTNATTSWWILILLL